jgi:erythromycin esterase
VGAEELPAEHLARLREVDALLHVVRVFEDPAHPHKLRFYGVDMQFTGAAASAILDYIAAVDGDYLEEAKRLLDRFQTEAWRKNFSTEAGREEARHGIATVVEFLDRHRDDSREWRAVRRFATVISQAMDAAAPDGPTRAQARERAMADNLGWLLQNHPPGTKAILWASNGHISRADIEGVPSMGSHLATMFGDQYVAIGFTFGRGSFQGRHATIKGVTEHTVDLPPAHYVESALDRVGLPQFFLGLRERPHRGPVAAWFDTPHPMRVFGPYYISADYPWSHVLVDQHFDALFYIDRTTRARPTPTGRRDE